VRTFIALRERYAEIGGFFDAVAVGFGCPTGASTVS